MHVTRLLRVDIHFQAERRVHRGEIHQRLARLQHRADRDRCDGLHDGILRGRQRYQLVRELRMGKLLARLRQIIDGGEQLLRDIGPPLLDETVPFGNLGGELALRCIGGGDGIGEFGLDVHPVIRGGERIQLAADLELLEGFAHGLDIRGDAQALAIIGCLCVRAVNLRL